MLKKFASVRFILSLGLILSIIFAAYNAYYKIKYWGFNITPKKMTDVWTIETHISFEPTGEPIKVSIASLSSSKEFKILDENIIAPGYKTKKQKKDGDNRLILTTSTKNEPQDIYYRVLLFDNEDGKGKMTAPVPPAPQKPVLDEQRTAIAQELIVQAEKLQGDMPQKFIRLLNQTPPNSTVQSFFPVRKTQQDIAEALSSLLSIKGVPNRIVKGIKLEEDKKSFNPDFMLEAYTGSRWKLYNIKTAQVGMPEDFIILQRGNAALLDVEGGENSSVKFSVLKSISSSFNLAGKRAKLADQKASFEFSIFNLPLLEQNTLKWLMIFPLAILVIVLMRNVIGIQTMGTFTPMLLSMALVKTGFWPGLICFTVIIGIGLIIRAMLSKLNLLLVPRISAVVIFVILIMQVMTICGYRFSLEIASSAVFFPIIIMAWIIERASITWEEDGPINAGKEVFNSTLVAIITYFIISSEYIRHIMFAFNELNLVILFIVMLLGTYTGYRLTELKRFKPLAKD